MTASSASPQDIGPNRHVEREVGADLDAHGWRGAKGDEPGGGVDRSHATSTLLEWRCCYRTTTRTRRRDRLVDGADVEAVVRRVRLGIDHPRLLAGGEVEEVEGGLQRHDLTTALAQHKAADRLQDVSQSAPSPTSAPASST
jgi:hypothetical protein